MPPSTRRRWLRHANRWSPAAPTTSRACSQSRRACPPGEQSSAASTSERDDPDRKCQATSHSHTTVYLFSERAFLVRSLPHDCVERPLFRRQHLDGKDLLKKQKKSKFTTNLASGRGRGAVLGIDFFLRRIAIIEILESNEQRTIMPHRFAGLEKGERRLEAS